MADSKSTLPLHHVAHLCAFRSVGDGKHHSLEILLVRNAFWDPAQNKPRDFAGEWMFPYASHARGDGSLVRTACRGFQAYLGYSGGFYQLNFLQSIPTTVFDGLYNDEFYSAQIDREPAFSPSPDLVISHQWMRVDAAFELVTSDTFERQQHGAFHRLGLNDDYYGLHALFQRQIHPQTVDVLGRLSQNPASLYAVPLEMNRIV